MSDKKQLNVSFDADTLREFEKVATAEHMDAQGFIRLLVGKFSEVKIGSGLAALTSIPREHFKGRPGRPEGSPNAFQRARGETIAENALTASQ